MEHPISQRIKIIIDREANGKVFDFANSIGGIPYQVITRLFKADPRSGKFPTPSTDIILSIINKFINYNPTWILTGDGEMLLEENKANNFIALEDELKYGAGEEYWRGRYDQIREDYDKLLKELGKHLK